MMIYLIIFVILLFVELAYFKIADYFNIIDKPNERSSHTRITLRGGGIIFYFGALAYFTLSGWNDPWFFGGLTLISVISFVDDVHSVSQGIRLVFHFAAMLMLFAQWGLYTEFPWWYLIVALIVCTGIINAYNFMDGVNGITGGYSLVVLLALTYINQRVVPFMDQEFLTMVILAVLVFCLFNFRKKAKCFAGDVGSVSIAFVVLFALGKLILTTGNVGYIVLLAVYGVDSVLTIIHRIMLHESIGLPHRKHLYQIMANELRIPHVMVSLVYMIVQAFVAVGAVVCETWLYGYLLLVVAVLSIIYVLFMKKYFHLHMEHTK